ncbi:MAG: hypothetical protein L3K00_07395 [Thermoplasmata archaeon]|nr:hypothetical protein [Thermoplasmata archaeon]
MVAFLGIEAERWVPLAALAALAAPEVPEEDERLALAYLPRGIPEANTYREVLERAVNWGRR